MVVLFALIGCDKLASAGEVVDGLGDTTVAQGLFLGAELPPFVELPDDAEIYTALCKVFLAEVSDASELADAPVSGAQVRFTSPASGGLAFEEAGPGEYRLTSQDGLAYEPGESANVLVDVGGEEGTLRVHQPRAPEFEVPESHTAHDPLRVKLEDSEFVHVVAAVYDIDHDNVTWDNLPADVEAAFELNAEADEVVEVLTIPAEAFARKSTYLVGVAGLEVGDTDEFTGVNRSLSTFAAGQLGLRTLVVQSVPD